MIAPTVLAALVAIGLPTAPALAPTPWVAPVPGPLHVIRPFAPPPPGEPWMAGHRGVDLAAGPGQVIRSAGPGTVSFAGPVGGRPVVVVAHGPLRTTYEPVEPSVSVGDIVTTGSPVGRLSDPVGSAPAPGGAPGGRHCAVPCLHWGLLRGDVYLDPLSLLHPLEVRLLPQTTLGRPQTPAVEPQGVLAPPPGEPFTAEPPLALAPTAPTAPMSERDSASAGKPVPTRFESVSVRTSDPNSPDHPTLEPAALARGVAAVALASLVPLVRGRRHRLRRSGT